MNPKNLHVRMDRHTGAIWLTEEKFRQPIRKITDITDRVMLGLCADLFHEEGTKEVSRDVRFADGTSARIIIRDTTGEDAESDEGAAETRL